jgi:hypothetical protein
MLLFLEFKMCELSIQPRDFLTDLSNKVLFSDLIWRFCRTSCDDQIRKAMLRTFKKQRSDMENKMTDENRLCTW